MYFPQRKKTKEKKLCMTLFKGHSFEISNNRENFV